MATLHFLSTDLTNRLGWTLIHSLWEGAAVASLLLLVLTGLRKRSPQSRYLASVTALACLTMGTFVTFVLLSPQAPPSNRTTAGKLAPALPLTLPALSDAAQPTAVESNSAVSPARIMPTPISLHDRHLFERMASVAPTWFAQAWTLGVMLLSLWHLGGWIAVQRLRLAGIRPVSAELSATARRLAQCLGISRPVRVLESLLVQTPIVIGALRPIVLIPISVLSGLTIEQLEAVIAHELAHIRRNDYLINLFQVAAETLLFYHPAAWWISRSIRLEREQHCDDLAVELCADRLRFVESLAALEEVRLNGSLALAARGSGGRELLQRIRRLLGSPDESPRRAARVMSAAIVFPLVVGAMAFHTAKRVTAADPPAPAQPRLGDAPTTLPATAPSAEMELAIDTTGVVSPYDRNAPSTRPAGEAQSVAIAFSIPEDSIKDVVRKMDAHQSLPVRVYDHQMKPLGRGSLVGIDGQIDAATGTLRCKAMVTPIENALLFPNQFVVVKLIVGTRKEGLGSLPTEPRAASSGQNIEKKDDADQRKLQVELEQARAQLARQEKAFNAGLTDGLALLAAKERAQVLEAESKGDVVGALKAHRAAAQQRADLQEARQRAGVAEIGEAEQAAADLKLAEANLAAAVTNDDTVVRVKHGRLEITAPDGTVSRGDSFTIDRGGKVPETITVVDGMVQFKTADTTLRSKELRFPALPEHATTRSSPTAADPPAAR